MSDTVHNGKHTKVARYGWSVQDQPGTFMMINKSDLSVDHRYQRDVKGNDKILGIAKDWSWIACGALIVALRDGKFFIIEGQHRHRAAMARADIVALPCLVFSPPEVSDEARGFLTTNTARKAMNMTERFNALLMTKDPAANKAAELVASVGRTIRREATENTLACVGALMQCIRDDEAAARSVLPLVAHLCRGRSIPGDLLKGAHYLERFAADGARLSAQPWSDRFLAAGHDRVINDINKAKAFYARGGSRIYADGIAQAVNYRAKTRLIALVKDATP